MEITRMKSEKIRTPLLWSIWMCVFLTVAGPVGIYAQGARIPSPHQPPIAGFYEQQSVSTGDHHTSTLTRLKTIVTLEKGNHKFITVLKSIARQAGLKLSYSEQFTPLDKNVNVQVTKTTAEKALWNLLEGTSLRFGISSSGQLVLLKRHKMQDPKVVSVQVETVKGKITDANTGESLPGANVLVKGTTIGTATDANGNYVLNVPSLSDSLVVSYVGYESKTVPINGRSVINITLTQQAFSGQQLVVIGYGGVRRKDLTGSISSVTSQELQKSTSSSFAQALQGRTAGVIVTQNSGRPGGGVSVNIRGVSTLGGNSEPLYVIDGVPISGYTGNGQTNALASLNPYDIQSIEVLKDASAEAIYGARAANGVVLITTKRGKPGQSKISYDGYFGLQQLPKTLPVMDLRQYAIYQNARYKALNWTPPPEFADPSILGEGTNWQDVLFRTAPMQNHVITLSGGNDKTQYLLSGNYFDQQGIRVYSWFKRYALRLNLDNQTTDWLKMGTSLHLSRTDQRINFDRQNLIKTAINQNPDIPVYNPDGSWGGPTNPQFTLNNPLGEAKLTENYQRQAQLIGSVYADIDFTKYLTLRQEFDGTFGYGQNRQFTPTYQYGAIINTLSSASNSSSNNNYWLIKTYLTFKKSVLSDLDVNVMVGHEAQQSSWEGFNGGAKDFLTNNVQTLNNGDATTASVGGYKGSNSLESYFGRANLSFRDRYLVTGTLRADGSSQFGPANRWGYFPSFAVAWRISNEPFMQPLHLIDNMKLRLSWGKVGNQNIGNYLYGSSMHIWATKWGSGLLPGNIPNPDVKWESTESYDAGLDISLFNQRVSLTADVYLKRTDGLLLQLPLPLYVGTSGNGAPSAPTVNIGSIDNRGLEFSLNTINVNSNLLWKTGIVFSLNKNKVTKLSKGNKPIDEQINDFDTVTRTEVGQPVGQLFGYVVDGIIQNGDELKKIARPVNTKISPNSGVWVGDFKFRDLNGDGVIDENDMTYLGNPTPLFQFGITNNFYYKNFDLSIFLNGNYGNKIFNELRREDENTASNFNLMEQASNFARLGLKDPNGSATDPDNVYVINSKTTIPRVTAGDANNNNRVSSAFVEDGTYLRIRNVTLGYTLPSRLTSSLQLSKLRVYVSAQNLYTFTKYTGYDPDVGSQNQSALLSGVDYGRYPDSRIFTFGIHIGL